MIPKNEVRDNQWWFWARGKGTHTCCDCGLVHDVVMQVTKHKQIKTKWSRNAKETAAERRKIKRNSLKTKVKTSML
jgi:Zn-finger protein